LTSALEGGGWFARGPGRLTPRKDPVHILLKAGWAPGPTWTCAKNLAPTKIRSPDRPALSQSLYLYYYYYYYYYYLTAIGLTPGGSSIHLRTNSTQNAEDGKHNDYKEKTITRKKITITREKVGK
jgi:hypothetical protein